MGRIGEIIFIKNKFLRQENYMNYSTDKEKKEIIKKFTPKSPVLRNLTLAFLFGGFICSFGELLFELYEYYLKDQRLCGTLVSLSLITLASLLTLFGVFDSIARYAGAGTLVPITGFSNAVVSEAMDSKSEGLVLGVGAKIFTVAGPVILFGISAGVLYGLIYFIAKSL